MTKQKYEMKIERSNKMDAQHMQQLSDICLAPYMQLADRKSTRLNSSHS